mmetsp:Transcript_17572/g.40658  ORF Transcript_17572/g.40658 Transcript_17572/m.40658 type:complete len:235 (+) Transcript_17572:96-800(+)
MGMATAHRPSRCRGLRGVLALVMAYVAVNLICRGAPAQGFACSRRQAAVGVTSDAKVRPERVRRASLAEDASFEWATEAPTAKSDAGSQGQVGAWLEGLLPEGGWDLNFFIYTVFLPSIPLFLVTLALVPVVEKYVFGREYDIDWSGKSGRLYKLLTAEDPLKVPDVEDDLKFYEGSYEDLKKMRDQETGVIGAMNQMFGAEDARRRTAEEKAAEEAAKAASKDANAAVAKSEE